MKLRVLLAAFAAMAVPAFAVNNGPFTIPAVPEGANTAAFSAPRMMEWIGRIVSNNTRAQQQAGKIQIVFDGDSITDFWQTAGKEIWAARYGKLNAFDFAISGDRTQNVLWRLDQGQMDNIHPKLIVLMIGTNNMGPNKAEEIAEGVKAIVAEYQKRCPEAVILLQAIFPRAEKADTPVRAKIKSVNQTISKLGDGKRVIYVDFGDKFLEPDGTLSKDVMPDFLHPGPKGYQIWADAIQPYIDQFFPPQPAQ